MPIRETKPTRNIQQREKLQQGHQSRGEEVDLKIRRKVRTRLRYELVIVKAMMSARYEIEIPDHR